MFLYVSVILSTGGASASGARGLPLEGGGDTHLTGMHSCFKRNSYPVRFVEFHRNEVANATAAFRKMINFSTKIIL